MADTAIPPENAASANPAATRMGNQNDTSWAGWAISSFTNKITTARGEIQPSTNGLKSPSLVDSRSSSVPPLERRSTPSLQPSQEKTQLTSASTTNIASRESTFSEPEAEAEDVMDAWGTMDDEEDSFFDAPSIAKKSSTTSQVAKTSVPFDDQGEPDFAGWLAAQSTAKTKKPLPKGMTKTSTTAIPSRPVVGGRPTTTGAKKLSSTTPKPAAPAVAKKIDTKPKDEGEGNDWDAWD